VVESECLDSVASNGPIVSAPESREVWGSGIRYQSAVPHLLGLRVRIPPRAWLSLVSVACCQVEVSASG
jgi:hypothetical protein